MEIKFVLLLILGFSLLCYGIFKLKAKENLYAKILVLTIAITGVLIVASKLLFKNTTIYPIVIFSGLTAVFSVLTIFAWSIRKVPEKKISAYIWFGTVIFLLFAAVVILVLIKTGFYG
jgi:hypothetical protein